MIEGCRPRGAACHKETSPTDNGANPSVFHSLCLSLVIHQRALPSIRWDVISEKVARGECKERNRRASHFCVTVLPHNQATKEARIEWPDDTGGKGEKEAETKGQQCEGKPLHLSISSNLQGEDQAAGFYPQDLSDVTKILFVVIWLLQLSHMLWLTPHSSLARSFSQTYMLTFGRV